MAIAESHIWIAVVLECGVAAGLAFAPARVACHLRASVTAQITKNQSRREL